MRQKLSKTMAFFLAISTGYGMEIDPLQSIVEDCIAQNQNADISVKGLRGNYGPLAYLNLSDYKLKRVPTAINHLSHLHTFNCDNNEISSFTFHIHNFIGMDSINLEKNQLHSLTICQSCKGQTPSQPSTLGRMNIRNNLLEILPLEIGVFRNLTILSLGNNKLTSLPTAIGSLKKLIALELNENHLGVLPDEIGNLDNLESLYLQHNNLLSLPATMGNLTKLRYLDITDNDLQTIPRSLGNLSFLKILLLSNNKLRIIPFELAQLEKFKLENLLIYNNPDLDSNWTNVSNYMENRYDGGRLDLKGFMLYLSNQRDVCQKYLNLQELTRQTVNSTFFLPMELLSYIISYLLKLTYIYPGQLDIAANFKLSLNDTLKLFEEFHGSHHRVYQHLFLRPKEYENNKI